MLNRRHIRIKVLQVLYAYYHARKGDIRAGDKELLFSLKQVYQLYVVLLSIIVEVRELAVRRVDAGKEKRLPTEADLNPNMRFIDNRVFSLLDSNLQLKREVEQRKINWADQHEMLGKIFSEIRHSEVYDEYMNAPEIGIDEEKKFAVAVFKAFIANAEPLQFMFDEESIYWADDLDLVCSMVIKTIKSFDEDSDQHTPLLDLFKDEKEEMAFAKDLFRKTILHEEDNSKRIDEKTSNWEIDRIAAMDIILMKMAITEACEFSSIPTKVTLNEYIEISKFYSTPKSNVFINGILDKIFADLKKEGKIKKIGRGLIE